MPLAYTAICG